MTDHDAIAAKVRCDNTLGLNMCAAYLDLYDEVKRLRAERDRFEAALGRACQVGGTTYLVERAEEAEAERDALWAALEEIADSLKGIARQALKEDSDE